MSSGGCLGLYTMVAWRSLRRHATYRAATAAGAFTNTIFGFIRAYILIALWTQRPDIGGYDVTAAVTFCFLGQSLIAAVGAFLPTVSAELTDRIRNGDIAIDLFRPADFQGWWLSHELGRAVHALIFRGVPPLLIGAAFFDFTWPAGWRVAAVVLSIALAIVVSFGIRYLVTLTAFWLLDAAGPAAIAMLAGTFLSGLLIPLVLLPGWLGTVARSTPWAATIQSPSDIWLGVYDGAGVLAILGLQVFWAVLLLLWCRVAEAFARLADAVRAFGLLCWAWTRAAWQYPTSLLLLTVGQAMATTLDVLAIVVIFANTDELGGFSATEVLFLYATTSTSFAIADTLLGTAERLGRHIRSGAFDVMLLRPVSALVQVAADTFSPRRLGKLVPALAALALSLTSLDTEWTGGRILMVPVMIICGTLIYCGIWVLGASYQFVAADAAEAMNVTTYGGNYVTQYPLTVFSSEWVRALTWVVPLAFVNWYPALYVFGRPDPHGYPSAMQFASPIAALLALIAAGVAWKAGVRHYRSTGS